MNTFANSLFAVLFGWAKRLIRQLWDDTVSGQFSGFFIWLGDHWVWVALGLILGCTVIDYLIWLIRWRPYLLWRAFFRRVGRFFRGQNRQFEKGYQSSVDIRLNPEREAETPAEEPETPEEESWIPEVWSQPQPQPLAEETPRTAPVFSAPEGREPRTRQFTPPQGYEAPPMVAGPKPVAGTFAVEMPAPRRRRRAERYERRRREWRSRLINGDGSDYEMLDGLPPAVDRQAAFHKPVYPQQNRDGEDAYSAWRPDQVDPKNG